MGPGSALNTTLKGLRHNSSWTFEATIDGAALSKAYASQRVQA